jgi:hypothetical protein
VKISNETFINLLEGIKLDPREWDGAAGTELLVEQLPLLLAGAARRERRHILEAVGIAWELLVGNDSIAIITAGSIGGLLRKKVQQRLVNTAISDRLLCGPIGGGKEWAALKDIPQPVGLNERLDIATAEAPESGERASGELHNSFALRTAANMVSRASGLSPEAARTVVDAICDAASQHGEGSTVTAVRRAQLAGPLGSLLGVNSEIWGAAVSLIFGSKRGNGSLLQAELDGELVGDWSENDRRVVTARKRMGLVSA